MHVGRHLLDALYDNVLREQPVKLIGQLSTIQNTLTQQPIRHPGCSTIKMSHHHTCMHAGISPPSSRHRNLLSQQQAKPPLPYE